MGALCGIAGAALCIILHRTGRKAHPAGVITVKEKQNVSMKKAGEILAGAARFKPISRVVIGRPDFHELAIRNAKEIVEESQNYKILPLSV